ncbi:MAG TPA: flagellin FliC [Candidatus Hydrogenedentes bacterium]|nr:flagellin FliC [Candidatus Hydrogenedentota bacterium]
MGLRIHSNMSALNAGRQVGNTTRGLAATLNQLASGLHINRAADDAAGLAIAERFRTRVRQYQQEANSLQSGINAVRTAEGGLDVQQEAVGRLRELTVQASNGTLTDDQRAALNEEAQQLIDQINDIGENTEFNGQALLNGEAAEIELGTEGGNAIRIEESTAESLGVQGIDLSTAEGAAAAVNTLDAAAQRLSQNRASLGAQENRLESAINQRTIGIENAGAAESAIRDADLARVTMARAQNEVLLRAGLGALTQANVVPQSAMALLGG